jgi:hypothetical protein
MKMTFLTPRDDAWEKFLAEVPHDFYHLSSYARFSSKYDGGEAEAVLVTDGPRYFFLPYVVRPLSSIPWLSGSERHRFDVTSSYGYPGPLCSPGEESFLSAAVAQWCDLLRERGAVSGFIRMHPLFPSPIEELATQGGIVQRGRTVSIDLTLSIEELWRQTRENHRRNIVTMRKRGLTVGIEDSREAHAAFASMYRETMDRVGASRYYYFSDDYFSALRQTLGPMLSLCIVRDAAGDPLSGGLFSQCCGIVQYHLGGTFNAALEARPSKHMFDFVRTWEKQRGSHVLHLGGGFGAKEDSLFDFKAGFSPRRHQFNTWHLIFDPATYQSLEGWRRAQSEVALDDSYFPVYRA